MEETFKGSNRICLKCGYRYGRHTGERCPQGSTTFVNGGENPRDLFTIIKPLSGETVLKSGPCKEEFDALVKVIGFHRFVSQGTQEFQKMIEVGKWRTWLLDNGFIGIKKQFKYFKSGTLFTVVEDWKDYPIADRIKKSLSNRSMTSFNIFIGTGVETAGVDFVFVLAHLSESHKYTLVQLSTGYHLRRNAVYLRTEKGIEIPELDLCGLCILRPGQGK